MRLLERAEKEFLHSLKKELELCVKGNISVAIKNDTLIVSICTKQLKTWGFTKDGIRAEITKGYSVGECMSEINKKYSMYIRYVFFNFT